MAKIFWMNIPAFGHVNPTLPVVAELVGRGHQVIYYNASTFEPVLNGTGAEFRAYPDSASFHSRLAARIHNLAEVSRLLLEESLHLVPFLIAEAEREQPGGMVFDSIALWGMLATRRLQIPSAASISTFIQDGVPGLLRWGDYPLLLRQALPHVPAIQRLRRKLVETYGIGIFPGKSILPTRGDANIVYTAREFQPDTPVLDATYHFVGPSILPSTRRETDFDWDRLDCARPRVYLSLGTLYNNQAGFYRAIFRTFAGHPAQFILSAGSQVDLDDLGPVPDNFLLYPSVPQLGLLPEVSLFITHGGMNSINESLYHGVPMVVLPQQIEQAFNGRQVARLGAGLLLADHPPYGRTSPQALKNAVDRVLADPAYQARAEQASRAFREAGGFRQAASVITSVLR